MAEKVVDYQPTPGRDLVLPGDQTSGGVGLQQAAEIYQEACKKAQEPTKYLENSIIDMPGRTQKNFSTVLPIEILNRPHIINEIQQVIFFKKYSTSVHSVLVTIQ